MHRHQPIASAITVAAVAVLLAASPAAAGVASAATNAAPAPDATPAAVGATVTGLVVDHTGAPLAGVQVTAVSDGASYVSTVRTDATGRYTFVGVPTGPVFLQSAAIAGTGGTPDPVRYAQWETRVTGAGQTTTVPRVLVHSTYDLEVGIGSTGDAELISGATLRAHDTVTGAVYDERSPFTVSEEHNVLWDIPSGTYTVELVTKATPTVPAEHWWFTGPSASLSRNASDAYRAPVHLSGDLQFFTGWLVR